MLVLERKVRTEKYRLVAAPIGAEASPDCFWHNQNLTSNFAIIESICATACFIGKQNT
jgi:hypothetical protein